MVARKKETKIKSCLFSPLRVEVRTNSEKAQSLSVFRFSVHMKKR